jgi:hypothetical protein
VRWISGKLTDDGGDSEAKCLLNFCSHFSGLILFLPFLFPFQKLLLFVPRSVRFKLIGGKCVASAAKGSERG